MSSVPLALHIPELLQEQVVAAREAGFYATETDLITDAIQMLLAARPDVRQATACQLYRRGVVSLGRAAELAALDIVSFKRALAARGMARTAPETFDETLAMAQTALHTANRA